MKWKDVLLTEDNKHIASVGGVNQAMMTDPFLRGFASANNVTYSGKTKTEIMENMINVKLTMDLTNESTSSGPKSTSSTPSRRQKKAKTTKLDCLLNENADGTLYRFIPTLFSPQVRDHITTLGNDANKNALDEKNKSVHYRVFTILNPVYNDESIPELKKVDWKDSQFFRIHDVSDDISSTYQKLSTNECIEVYNYIQTTYKQAMNKNTKSGSHVDFRNYVQGKHWLLYYRERLDECQCEELIQLANPQLASNVIMTSLDGHTTTNDYEIQSNGSITSSTKSPEKSSKTSYAASIANIGNLYADRNKTIELHL